MDVRSHLNFRPLMRVVPLALVAAWAGAQAQEAQTAPVATTGLSRAQVVAERDAWMSRYRIDEASGAWVLRSGSGTQAPGRTRAEVVAERDAFLASHHWEEGQSLWVRNGRAAPVPATATRAQVRADTVQFMATHTWNEGSQLWMDRTDSRPMR